eukprot:Opistho-1_new@4152
MFFQKPRGRTLKTFRVGRPVQAEFLRRGACIKPDVLVPEAQQPRRHGVRHGGGGYAKAFQQKLGHLQRRSCSPGIEQRLAPGEARHRRGAGRHSQIHAVVVPSWAVRGGQVKSCGVLRVKRQLQRGDDCPADIVHMNQVRPSIACSTQVTQAPGMQPSSRPSCPEFAAGPEYAAGPQDHRLAPAAHKAGQVCFGFAFGAAVPSEAWIQWRVLVDQAFHRTIDRYRAQVHDPGAAGGLACMDKRPRTFGDGAGTAGNTIDNSIKSPKRGSQASRVACIHSQRLKARRGVSARSTHRLGPRRIREQLDQSLAHISRGPQYQHLHAQTPSSCRA